MSATSAGSAPPAAAESGAAPRTAAVDHDSHRLKALRDIASLVNAGSDLHTILQHIVAAVCHHTAWSMGGIMKVDLESGFSELMARFDPGTPAAADLPTRWSLTTSPALRVAGTGTPVVIADARSSEEFPGYRADALARGYRTVVILPIAATDAQGNRMVLSVQSRDVVPVSETELAFLGTIAHLGAIAVEKAKRLDAERAQSERLRRMLAVNETLLARALAGDSLTSLLATMEALLPEPLVVVDLTTRDVFAHRSPAPEVIGEPQWRRFARRKAASLLLDLAQRQQGDGFTTPAEVDFSPCGLDLRLPAYIEPMQIDGEAVGALVLFAAQGAAPDLLLAQEVRLAINVHLLRGYVRAQSRAESAGELIGALVGGAPLGHEAVAARAERLGVDLSRPATLLAVGWPEHATASPPRMHQAMSARVARLWPGALAAQHGSAIALLLPQAAGQPDAAHLNRIRVLARRLAQEFADENVMPAVAIGGYCRDLADYSRAWSSGLRLLRLAKVFGRSGVLEAKAFGPFADLLSAIDHAAVQDFIGRTLGVAAEYDARHKAQLVDTVARFLEGGGRYQACAQQLEIHVTTLRYRIARFQELTGADLGDGETRFALSLALRLRTMHRVGP